MASKPRGRLKPAIEFAEKTRTIPSATTIALVLGTAYLFLFYLAELPSMSAGLGEKTRRIDLLALYLLVPEKLFEQWFEGASLSFVTDRLLPFGWAAIVSLVAVGLGRLAMWPLRAMNLSRLEANVFAAGVGFNLLSLGTLALGLAGLSWRVGFGVACVLVVAGAVLAMRGWKPIEQTPTGSSKTGARLLWLCVPFAVVILLAAALPPADFDVREYHLQAPKEFYQAGSIQFLPHNVYANMALGSEMLSLLAMSLLDDWFTGAIAGKILTASFSLWTAAALFAAGRRFYSAAAGALAALIYISTPWTVHLATNCLVEGPTGFYGALAIYAILLSRKVQSANGFLLVAGFLAGGAVACKYPAALFVAVPLTVWVSWSEWRQRRAWGVFAFIGGVAIGCGLWFAKNWAHTGNPVYPLLYPMFDGATRTLAKHQQWTAAHSPDGFTLANLWRDVSSVAWRSEWLSPLLIPLAAVALVNRENRRKLRDIALYVMFVFAAWWLVTHRIDRFWLPVTPIIAFLAGVGGMELWRAWRGIKAARYALVTVLAACLAANFVFSTSRPVYNAYFAPLDALRARVPPLDPWHAYLNAHTSGGDAVLLVGDAQPFDLIPRAYYNTVFDDSIFESLVKDRTADEIRAEFAQRNIKFVYVRWDDIARYRQPGNYGFTPFVQPEVFTRLVREGVLLPPLLQLDKNPNEVYPVRGKANAAAAE